jgi:hypothetical protein
MTGVPMRLRPLLLAFSLISILWFRSPAAEGTETGAVALKTRLANLTEIILPPGVTDVDFYGTGVGDQEGATPQKPIELHYRGNIVVVLAKEWNKPVPRRIYIPTTGEDGELGTWSVVRIPYEEVNHNEYLASSWVSFSNDPHLGDDMIKSVRFFDGFLDGTHTTHLIVGESDTSRLKFLSYAAPAHITAMKFTRTVGGAIPASFDSFSTIITRTKYCNADMALFRELAIPLPRDYSGQGSPDGC